MNTARENILGRIRSSVRTEAHRPMLPNSNPVFPPVTNPVARFQQEFIAIKGEIITDLPAFLANFPKIVSSVMNVVAGNAGVHEADLGVTGCDCLVAQTGSIFVNARAHGGRAISVLPPVHLVIAKRDQVVPDLAAAFALLRSRHDAHWPSSLALITGPSRTADIEKILVMGAHGPKRLAVFFE